MIREVIFVWQNILRAIHLERVRAKEVGDITVRGLSVGEVGELEECYNRLNEGRGLSRYQKILFHIFGVKLCFVALQDEKIIAFDLFYFNKRDIVEGTVHEGFVGVDERKRGRGLSVMLRGMAREHFKRSGLKGISSRISKTNMASLASAWKVGFEVMEDYVDASGLERYYLVLWFDS